MQFIIISSHNFSLGIRFERTKPIKLIGDDNQSGVFPADDSQNGFLPKDVFSATINSKKLIELFDIAYKTKTQSDQLIIPFVGIKIQISY